MTCEDKGREGEFEPLDRTISEHARKALSDGYEGKGRDDDPLEIPGGVFEARRMIDKEREDNSRTMTAPERVKEREYLRQQLGRWSNESLIPRAWRIFFFGFSACALVGGALLWIFGGDELMIKMENFNGALTVPVGAILFFVFSSFIIMLPMKEIQLLVARVLRYTVEATDTSADTVRDEIREARKAFREEMESLRAEIRGQRDEADEALARGEAEADEILREGSRDGDPPSP